MANRYWLRAEADLEDIWQYTARQWSVDQAERYKSQLLDHIEALVFTPHLGRDVSEIRPALRRSRSGSHFVFYRILDESGIVTIDVVRILHNRMDHIGHPA